MLSSSNGLRSMEKANGSRLAGRDGNGREVIGDVDTHGVFGEQEKGLALATELGGLTLRQDIEGGDFAAPGGRGGVLSVSGGSWMTFAGGGSECLRVGSKTPARDLCGVDKGKFLMMLVGGVEGGIPIVCDEGILMIGWFGIAPLSDWLDLLTVFLMAQIGEALGVATGKVWEEGDGGKVRFGISQWFCDPLGGGKDDKPVGGDGDGDSSGSGGSNSVEDFFRRSVYWPVFASCDSLCFLWVADLSFCLVSWTGCTCSGWFWYQDGFDRACSQSGV